MLTARAFQSNRIRGALPPSFQRRIAGGIFACTLLGAAAVYWTLAQVPSTGTFHDDGIYVVTAKALAEDQGYRIISIPGEPPQTKYPILFPWLLSLVWRLNPSFPANLPWLRLVPIAAALGWLCLSWPLLRRLGASIPQTTAIVVLTAVSPWVAFLSTALMSETVFALLLTAALLIITRAYQGDGTRVDPLIAGFLLGAAVLTRIAGIAPAAAGVVAFLTARRWGAAMQCLLGTAVVILPWFWWVSHQPPTIDSYYSATIYASWNIVTSYTWPQKAYVVGLNSILGGMALTQIWGVLVPYAVPALLLAAAALTLVGGGLWRARHQPVAIAMVAYCALHLAWVWPPLRFLVPLTPLFLWFGLLGAGRRRYLGYAAALVLFTTGGFQLWTTVAQARAKGIVSPVSGAEDWDATARALDWISRETPSDTLLTGNLDPMYYLFTSRKAVRAFAADPYLLFYNVTGPSENPLGTADGLRSRLLAMKSDYLLITATLGREEVRHLRGLVFEVAQGCPGGLIPVLGSSDSNHVIYRIDRARLEHLETCANALSGR